MRRKNAIDLKEGVFSLVQDMYGDRNRPLHEALLWRGFLIKMYEKKLALARGSHELDIRALEQIEGLTVIRVADSHDVLATLQTEQGKVASVLIQILDLPSSQGGTGVGVADGFFPTHWRAYRRMKWGAKLPVTTEFHLKPTAKYAFNAPSSPSRGLDIGIALLIKVMPLICVATSSSCDGHGIAPAYVSFHYPWDWIWGQAVFDTLGVPIKASYWNWGAVIRVANYQSLQFLEIWPAQLHDKRAYLDMCRDIQSFSRTLLDDRLIETIRLAREMTIKGAYEGITYETARENLNRCLGYQSPYFS